MGITNDGCRLSKKNLPYANNNKSKEFFESSRSQVRCFIELISEQKNLNYIQSKIYPGIVGELCRFCEEEDEAFQRIINECS